MKRLILTYCILTILTSCSRTNLLTYKNKKFYEENSIILSDTTTKLYQRILYNRPGIIDEEFSYDLTLTFLDTAAARTKKILNLETDTLIIKSRYGVFSIWNWEVENNKVSGQIEIVAWDKNSITLKENIYVSDFRRNETRNYNGTRTYKREEGW